MFRIIFNTEEEKEDYHLREKRVLAEQAIALISKAVELVWKMHLKKVFVFTLFVWKSFQSSEKWRCTPSLGRDFKELANGQDVWMFGWHRNEFSAHRGSTRNEFPVYFVFVWRGNFNANLNFKNRPTE